MSDRPTYFLLMMDCVKYVGWCELDWDEWQHVEHQPNRFQIYVIDGQRAKVLVASSYPTLSRKDALKTASLFILGAYSKIEIDLKNLEGVETKGQPKLHPPH